VLKEVNNSKEASWFKKHLDKIEENRELWNGNFVSHVVPSIYPAYCKIFHPIYEDLSIKDHSLSWNDIAKRDAKPSEDPVDKLVAQSVTVYGGDYDPHNTKRIRWGELAKEYGLVFHPEINGDSFTRNFPGFSWPRYLIGPEEGNLDSVICKEIVRSIATATSDFTLSQKCFFHYDLIATQTFKDDKLIDGQLIDVFRTVEFDDVYTTPTRWWATNRSWFVCSDWDLTFTLVGGADGLVESLIGNLELDCLRVEPSTRIDYRSDRINPNPRDN
jgi:hypothetical protein